MRRYRYAAADAVVVMLSRTSRRDGERLLRAFVWLAENPMDAGDFVQRNPDARPLYVRRFGKWLVRFWNDHGNCEVRIIDVEKIGT